MDEAVTRLAIGVGCRRSCPAESVLAVIQEACDGLDLTRAGVFTIDTKRDEPGLHEAAATLGLCLAFLSRADLAAVADRIVHRSARVEAAVGVPSVAEAAALAGAGAGGRLIVPRIAHAAAACAVALAAETAA